MAVVRPEPHLRSSDATWRCERWEQLPDDGNRYEVIDGVLYKSKSPSYFHQWIVIQLMDLVGLPLRRQGIGIPGIAPLGVFMPRCDPAQPDFFLVRSERAEIIRDGFVIGTPDLIVEVLSASNPAQDTVVKRRAYALPGVPEYWIVRPAIRDVLVYTRPDESRGDYAGERLVEGGSELDSPTLPIRFVVNDLFAGSPDTTL